MATTLGARDSVVDYTLGQHSRPSGAVAADEGIEVFFATKSDRCAIDGLYLDPPSAARA